MSIVHIDDPKVFIGLIVDAAKKQVAENGYDVRTVMANTYSAVHKLTEYDPLRITLIIDKDVVTDAVVG